MKLRLVRFSNTDESTEGKLYIDGVFECHTLEDKDRKLEDGGDKVYGKTAIPRGTYEVIITYSNRFKRDMPLLVDVPGFTGIRIHSGNTSADTDGCILVGDQNSKEDDNFVGASKIAYNRLFKKLKETEEKITIEVT